jgi:hypothetical protein
MPVRIFSQAPSDRIDLAALVRHAGRFFEAKLEVIGQRELRSQDEGGPGHEVGLRIDSARRGFSEQYRVRSREANAEDYEAARRAEERGRATNMSLLAERCRYVWEVEPVAGTSSAAPLLNLCAVLASVALGPVLPEDESTLFGIRGAMERLDALTGPSLQR